MSGCERCFTVPYGLLSVFVRTTYGFPTDYLRCRADYLRCRAKYLGRFMGYLRFFTDYLRCRADYLRLFTESHPYFGPFVVRCSYRV